MNDHDFNSSADLSPAGEARRESMLADLRVTMTARRRRKTAARAGIGAAALVVAAASALTLMQRPAPVTPTESNAPLAAAVTAPALKVVLVPTDPTTLTRLRADGPKLVRTIGDDELLALAAAGGSSYGLIRTAQGARLVANHAAEGSGPQ